MTTEDLAYYINLVGKTTAQCEKTESNFERNSVGKMLSNGIATGNAPVKGKVNQCGKIPWFVVVVAFFRAARVTYGGSQARGRIRATDAGLHHSSWQCLILNPLSEARDRTRIPIDASRIC